jgi:subtilisin family serine protease
MLNKRLQQVISQVKDTTTIPIIIELKMNPTSALVQQLTGLGVRVARTSQLRPIVYGTATPPAIQQVTSLPFISRIYYDEPIYPALSLPFGLEQPQAQVIPVSETINTLGVQTLWDQGLTGKGVKIGVIDTGISQNHDMFRGAIKGTYSAVPNEDVEDQHSHGTWCASAAAGRPTTYKDMELTGAAPEADLYALKALSAKGGGQMSWVMDCIEKAVMDFKCDILSMSLGSLVDNAGADPISRLVNDVVMKHNTLCVIAAGNSALPLSIGSPGGAIAAVTVGSISMKLPTYGLPSTFESKGPTTALLVKPDTAAPGGNVISKEVTELILAAGLNGAYTPMAGTSMATPQVAGALALLRQAKPDLSRVEVEELFAMSSFPRVKEVTTGYGPLRVDLMHSYFDKLVPMLSQLQQPLSQLQSLAYLPGAILPSVEREQLQAVRLPVIMSGGE